VRRPDIPVLTTLRFPAAFAIVLFHFLAYTPCPRWVWEGFDAGVSFFYVLSGFILYYNYADLPDRAFFWLARFARIWPVHIVTLLLAFALLPFNWLDGHATWPITLPVNIFLLHAWLPSQGSVLSYNGVSWSLSVEAFFYLCFPWLLGAMRSRGPAPLLVGSFIIGLLIVVASTFLPPAQMLYVWPFNPGTRLFEFVLGMAACHWWQRERVAQPRQATWTGLEVLTLVLNLVLIIGGPALLHALGTQWRPLRWFASEFSVIGFGAMLWVFAHQAGWLSRILSVRAGEWLGETSFALYMCHQTLLRWLDPKVMTHAWESALYFAPYFLGCLAFAAALYHLVETPARKAIIRLYRKPRRV
jgi:peptidoglycan/LPS O-acetylase OafA/YrhL